MSDEDKLEMLKMILDIQTSDTSEDARLTAYLTAAGTEIISWRYSYSSQTITAVPAEYEVTQVFAVIAGYSQSGAENQTSHNENAISRTFSYPDMVHYIRAMVVPICGVM